MFHVSFLSIHVSCLISVSLDVGSWYLPPVSGGDGVVYRASAWCIHAWDAHHAHIRLRCRDRSVDRVDLHGVLQCGAGHVLRW